MGSIISFKIDDWWKAFLIFGIAAIAVSLLFDIDIINRKHLLGVGIGMFIVGIANWMALKTVIREHGPDGFFYGQIPIHNTFTKTMQVVGFALMIGFGIWLIWGLL